MTDETRTSLTNLALREIGGTRVDAWDANSPSADIARDVWGQARRKALSRHEWQFALKTVRLPRSADVPAGRYSYRYTLPGDHIRTAAVCDHEGMDDEFHAWRTRQGSIETSAEAVYIDYVYDAPAIGAWPAWFVDLFVADMAALMAAPMKSTTERERLEKLLVSRLREARTIDSGQQPTIMPPTSRWAIAQKGGR